jgi:hypothetical protein
MRVLIALFLAFPLYYITNFGWEYFLIIGLQLLAGIDSEIFRRN